MAVMFLVSTFIPVTSSLVSLAGQVYSSHILETQQDYNQIKQDLPEISLEHLIQGSEYTSKSDI